MVPINEYLHRDSAGWQEGSASRTATGVALAPALTAVLAFRTATFWLPAPIGWVALVALQRRGRI